jgi:ATP-binding protein involved in chromosome partitioning
MVTGVRVSDAGAVQVEVALTIAGCPLRGQLEHDVTSRLAGLPGVASVELQMGEMDAAARSEVMGRARWKARQNAPETGIDATTRILAVGSGKGGVGKSSVTVNHFARGVRRVTEALAGLEAEPLIVAEVSHFQNVNTPEDWARYAAK